MMEFSERVSLSRMMLSEKFPFFGTLCYYADVRESIKFPTAWTNGRKIWFNPDFAKQLTDAQFIGVLIHEVLHCALMHPSRRGERDPLIYNLAADIVVNGMIDEANLELPSDCVRHNPWEKFSTEEVYSLVQHKCPDHLQPFLLNPSRDIIYITGEREGKAIEAHWEIANHNAATQSRMFSPQGSAEWERLFSKLTASQIDWRSRLWEFMVRTPCDYSGYDRRFIHDGLYLETLDGESCQVFICCDTSASVDEEQLGSFLGEVQGILTSYPGIKARLWFADTELSKGYDLSVDTQLPTPTGGGGTSFVPFFDEIQKEIDGSSVTCAIYLTDGYGEFPEPEPDIPTLWVVTPGGLEDSLFPFGSTTRLLED